MGRELHEWLYCPDCESAEIGLLAYGTTLSFECYGCGITEEFEVDESPLHELDTE